MNSIFYSVGEVTLAAVLFIVLWIIFRRERLTARPLLLAGMVATAFLLTRIEDGLDEPRYSGAHLAESGILGVLTAAAAMLLSKWKRSDWNTTPGGERTVFSVLALLLLIPLVKIVIKTL